MKTEHTTGRSSKTSRLAKGDSPRTVGARRAKGGKPAAQVQAPSISDQDSAGQRPFDILEILPVYTILLSEDYHVRFANRFFRDRFGESHGQRCYEYLFARTEPCEICESFVPMRTNAPHRWQWTGPDGRDYDIYDYPVRDSDGSRMILETGVHVTERNRVERALRESEEKFKYVFENSAVAKSLTLPDGTMQPNAAFCKMLGYSAAQLQKLRWQDITFPDDISLTEAAIAPLRAGTKDSARFVKRYVRKDGSFLWADAATSLRRDQNGKPLHFMTSVIDITHRIEAQQALQRASAYNRSLIEASLDPLVTIGPDGKITDVNQATELATGLDRRRLVGTDFSDYFTEPAKARAGYKKVLADGFVRDYPLTIQHASGSTMDVLYNAAVYKNEGGQVQGVFAAARDVTQLQRAEEEVRSLNRDLEKRVADRTAELAAANMELAAEVEERQNAQAALLVTNRRVTEILESIQDGFFALDSNWRLTYVNQRAAANFSLPAKELVGQVLWDKFPHILGTQHETSYRKAMEERISVRFEIQGGPGAPSYDVRVYPSADGISVYWIDITLRSQMEQQLRDSEERYKSMFETNSAIMFLMDPLSGALVDANPAACDFYGYSRQELTGKKISEISVLALEERNVAIQKTLSSEETHFYSRHRLSSGDVREIEAYSTPIQVQGRTLIYSIIYDITERRRAEQAIARLDQDLARHAIDLQAANKELEAFAYSVSHDLRAPLRHIDGYIELLQRKLGPSLDEESLRYLNVVAGSARQMGNLIDDLLTFSRMGRAGMVKSQVDLGGLVADVIRELEADITDRKIRWSVSGLPAVDGDHAMLRLVIANLLSNALKFTRSKSEAHIEIGCLAANPEEAVVFVRDNGVGFDMAYADKLFNVFERLHRMEEFEGTGIGLANVRRVINRHGGRTWAEGRLGEGATFYFSLPVQSPRDR